MGDIICFYGANSKVGVTMICQTMAELIASQNPDKKVLILHLDGTMGMEFCGEHGEHQENLDDIKVRLVSDILTIEEFLEACSVDGNLYSLGGTGSLKERCLFMPQIVEKLFQLVKSGFDSIIVDAGSGVGMGLSIGSLQFSDYRILVTTQQETSYQQFILKNKQVLLPLKIKFDFIVLNKYVQVAGLKDEFAIKNNYGIYEVVNVPMSDFGWQAEADKSMLIKYKEKDYLDGIRRLGHQVRVLNKKIELKNEMKPRKPFWKRKQGI